MADNCLYYGDNLEVMRKYIKDESVDLIYLDPPFNSNRAYNVIFDDQTGKKSSAQIQVFEDTWFWSVETQNAFDEIMTGSFSLELKEMMKAFRDFMGETNLMAYLTMMAIRLVEMHRVLKQTGSIYLHCDPTASHYLKVLLDHIYGPQNFRNEIIWKRTGAHGRAKRWGPIHDTLLFYTMSSKYTWNRVLENYDPNYINNFYRQEDEHGRYQSVSLDGPGTRTGDSGKPWRDIDPTDKGRHWELPPDRALPEWFEHPEGYSEMSVQERLDVLDEAGLIYWPTRGKIPRFKRYLSVAQGNPVQDIISDIQPIGAQATERLGYPTQKPVTLLERIIMASSNEGDVVLDPFCGCGTAIAAAEKLGRKWIGIDITHLAVSLIKKRIKDHFPDAKFDVVGEPKSVGAAEELFKQSPFQFEAWAVSLIGGQPYKSTGGGDTGMDGFLFFKDYEGGFHKIILEVKGGGYQPKDVRALAQVLEREKSPMGVLIALKPPTKGMIREATALGKWNMPGSRKSYPVLQIITIQDFFDDRMPDLPDTSETLRKAKRQARDREMNHPLFL